jgi:hypothetical protein
VLVVRREFPLEQRASLVTDRREDVGGAQGVRDVVDVDDEHRDAAQDEDERDGRRQPGDERQRDRFTPHGAQHGHRVDERRHEHAESDLGHPVLDEPAQHARGELAAGQLQGHDSDREHQAGERNHR